MPRLWSWISAALLAGAVLPAAGALSSAPARQASGGWAPVQALASRLAEERRRLDGLREEIARLRYAAEDLRDVQVYPERVTRLPRAEADLDRRLESLEAGTRALALQAEELGRALEDAVFVLRGMAKDRPNREMVELLRQANVERIARYLALGKSLSAKGGGWDEALAAARHLRARGGIAPPPATPGIEDDFYRALLSHMDGLARRFHEEFHAYKDSLAARGVKEDWEKMARIDLARVQARLERRAGSWTGDNLERISRRYSGRIAIGVVDHYLGETLLTDNRPLQAVEAFSRVQPGSRMTGRSRLGILRAFFAAGRDDSVSVVFRAALDSGLLPAPLLPTARYLAVQSLYVLGADSALEAEVLAAGKARGRYPDRTLFVYAKSLVRTGRRPEARAVLRNLSGQAQVDPALRRDAALALAHLAYEEGLFENALRAYKERIEDSVSQAEALYGMVWCNLHLGDLDGAEFVLKKLIAQRPDSPWAIDGFLVYVRKLMVKAREEWGYRRQVEGQMEKLRELRERLASRGAEEDAETKALRGRLAAAEAGLAKARPLTAEAVAALYQQAAALCDFVENRYRTGEFSDARYLGEREAVLVKLDEASRPPETAAPARPAAGGRESILAKVSEVRSLGLEIHLLHKAWLEELLRYYQVRIQQDLAAAAARADTAQTRVLRAKSRRLADAMSERLAAKSASILDRIAELSTDPRAAGLEDWLLFQRGYLLYTRAEDALKRRLALNRLLEENLSLSGLEEGRLDAQAYEQPWLELIRRHPGSPHVAAALYFLGYARAARGESELGLRHFEELAERFPQSPYAQQALIFVGEHYFNENNLAKAERAYDQVLDHPESKYFDQALYKLAWTRYRASTYKSAISSFTYLLGESQRDARSRGKGGHLLTQESLQYAALSLAESDTTGDGGFSQTRAFGEKLGDPRVGAQLLHRMAGIYLKQGRLERARRALETLLQGYPGYENLPEAMVELAQAFDKGQNFSQAAEVREKLLIQYGPGTDWYRGLEDAATRVQADSTLERAVDDLARHHLYEAKRMPPGAEAEEKRSRAYRKAISAYERLLAAYPAHPRASRYAYQQAEAHYAMEDFSGAAKKYLQVSRMGQARLAQIAAYNAIVAAQEWIRKEEEHAPE